MISTILTNMFVLSIPILEKILRPILVYLFLIIGLRVAGKRELAQLNPFDLVVLLTLSNTVQNAIIGNDNSLLGGIIGAATLLFVNYLVVRFVYTNRKIEKIVEGDEDYLIDHGELNLKRLEQELITREELEIVAHRQGFHSLDEIETAILEPEGAISLIGKAPMPEEQRQHELLDRMAEIDQQLKEIKLSISELK